jgi:hypothetical protein
MVVGREMAPPSSPGGFGTVPGGDGAEMSRLTHQNILNEQTEHNVFDVRYALYICVVLLCKYFFSMKPLIY